MLLDDLPGGEWLEVPEGWEGISFFGRLVNAGVCRLRDLTREPAEGGLTVREVFDLHRMLDWKLYGEITLAERRKAASPG
ncbi:MAG: hypothetical protein LBU64_06435 [Planctomycetota bacterium]|jgi:hypothetical protein|nr:hypothetical protein [Planctomycetota bacterium]